jgi:hypothetical protein
VLSRGQAGVDVEALGKAVARLEIEAQHPDERRVFDQKSAQLAHRGLVFVQLDQEGGDVGRPRLRLTARPGAVRVAFG